jgi:aryl-alcohol dehydrogenase-like predicted oxidoreductase
LDALRSRALTSLDGYRQRAFLMTKFDGPTRRATAEQIDESQRRLQADHIDLIQLHENIRMEDPDRFFARQGPLEALLAAKRIHAHAVVGCSDWIAGRAPAQTFARARHVN